jgi:hypothetical protein
VVDLKRLALVCLLIPAAAQAQQYEEVYVEEPPVLIDFGLHVEVAFSGLGDDDGTTSDSYFGMGGAIGGHIGVDVGGFVALLMIDPSLHVQLTGSSGRGYAGIGPSILLGWRPTLSDGARLSMELGGGFDYGVSAATADGTDRAVRAEGVFPTIHHRVLVTARDGDGLPITTGLHLMAAIPTDAPHLFMIAGTIVIGLRTM